MLILSRKIGESLVIDENIFIKILDISGGCVKLGIEAPKEMSVLRAELLAKELEEVKKTQEEK